MNKQIKNRYSLENLKEAANLKIFSLLESLGFKDLKDRYGYIQSCCLHELADNKTAFSYHVGMKIWHCFTKNCHIEYGCDIIGLVRFALDTIGKPSKFTDAIKYLEDFLGQKVDKITLEDEEIFLKNIKKINSNKIQKKYNEDVLKNLKPHDYLVKRGFKIETILKFGIGYCDKSHKKFFNRIVIPVRDISGQIVGFTARWAGDETKNGVIKWLHSFDFQKKNNLFNLHEALSHIRETGEAIVVEGPIDVIKLYEYDIFNAVAIFGTSLSYMQKTIILSNASSIVLALDSDAAGKCAMENIANELKNYLDVYRISLPQGKDIDELSQEEIKEIFKSKMRI